MRFTFARAVILASLALAVGWIAALYTAASRLMRRRRPDPSDTPDNYGIAYEEVRFASRDRVSLVGWWIPAENPIGTVIMCHGQEGSMDGDTRQMVPLHDAGFNVFMFDFRAHGRSDGDCVSMGMYEKEDLLGALDMLAECKGIERVGVLGFSMGAAVALITAALSERIGAIVADSSFGRLRSTLTGWGVQKGIPFPIARQFASWVLIAASIRTEGRMDQTDPIRWTVHIGPRPILFIHGADDPFVPMEEVNRMASLAEGPVEVWSVEGVDHRGAYAADPVEYNNRVIGWFKQHLAAESWPNMPGAWTPGTPGVRA
jgi:pimeloyl-ACP methyl ester carboxylesterase